MTIAIYPIVMASGPHGWVRNLSVADTLVVNSDSVTVVTDLKEAVADSVSAAAASVAAAADSVAAVADSVGTAVVDSLLADSVPAKLTGKEQRAAQKALREAEKQRREDEKQQRLNEKLQRDSIARAIRDSIALSKLPTKEERIKMHIADKAKDEEHRQQKSIKYHKHLAAKLLRKAGDPEELEDSIVRRKRAVGMPRSLFNKWYEAAVYDSRYSHGPLNLRDLEDSLSVLWTQDSMTMVNMVNRRHALYMEEANRVIDEFVHVDTLMRQREAQSSGIDEDRMERVWDIISARQQGKPEFEDFSREITPIRVDKWFAFDSVFTGYYKRLSGRRFIDRLSIRANVLSWVLAVPSLGIEFDLSKHAKGRYSLILEGQFNPNTSSIRGWNNRPRVDLNVRRVHGEVRKYWRTGGMNSIVGVDNEYALGDPDKNEHQYKDYGWDMDHLNFLKFKEYDEDSVSHYTRSWLYRRYAPFRYRALSGRYLNHPRTSRTYYLGLQGGAEDYMYIMGRKGRQGKDVWAGISTGMVTNVFPFPNGSSLELDMGFCLGVQAESYTTFKYQHESGCYLNTGSSGRRIKPRPVLKDVHVTLAYAFRPMRNKVNQFYHIYAFRDKAARKMAENTRHGRLKMVDLSRKRYAKRADSLYMAANQKVLERIMLDTAYVTAADGMPRTDTIYDSNDRIIAIWKVYCDEVGDYHIVNGKKSYHPLHITGSTPEERERSYKEALRVRDSIRIANDQMPLPEIRNNEATRHGKKKKK